jgi:hypothetical protein
MFGGDGYECCVLTGGEGRGCRVLRYKILVQHLMRLPFSDMSSEDTRTKHAKFEVEYLLSYLADKLSLKYILPRFQYVVVKLRYVNNLSECIIDLLQRQQTQIT